MREEKVEYSYKLLDELELAYAITIHKSRGKRISGCCDPSAQWTINAHEPESVIYGCDEGKKMCHTRWK